VEEPRIMQFQVAQLLKDPVGATRDYLVDEAINILEGFPPGRVWGRVNFLRTSRGVLAKGRLNTRVELACSRCLEYFPCELEYGFEEEYFPVLDIYHDEYVGKPEDRDSFIIDENHILDITEAARQYAILAIPMKPLCRPGCEGIKL